MFLRFCILSLFTIFLYIDNIFLLYHMMIERIIKFLFYFLQVFIGETLSARVSHLHIRPSTTQKITKTKSSGLCVSTGTGSTSWHTSINRLSKKNVEDLLHILKGNNKLNVGDINAEEISEEYNRRLVFEPGE